MYTINDLSKQLGLEPAFIRKCKNSLSNILDPHIKKGDKNKDLFTTNAFVIFQQISKYKDEGYSIAEIKKQLEKEIKTVSKTEVKQVQTPESDKLLNKVFELQQQLLDEKDRFIRDQEEKNKVIIELEQITAQLKNELKLLPEGKSPEEIKIRWEQEQVKKVEKTKLIDELYSTSIFQPFKRKRIYEKIKELDNR